jgi:hypothetical protein
MDPVPKCRNFRANDPRRTVHLHEVNGHLDGAMPAIKNKCNYSLVFGILLFLIIKSVLRIRIRIRIRIHRIFMFLGHLDTDPDQLVTGIDSDSALDPYIIRQK